MTINKLYINQTTEVSIDSFSRFENELTIPMYEEVFALIALVILKWSLYRSVNCFENFAQKNGINSPIIKDLIDDSSSV